MRRWTAAALLLAAACGGAGGGRSSPDSGAADRAHALYLEGKLDASERELASLISREPGHTLGRRLLGRILLLKGRSKESSQQFLSYVSLVESEKVPPDGMALQDLFWAFYRMDEYARAAEVAGLLRDSVFAVKYGEIARRGPPYTSEWSGPSSVLSFEGAGSATARVNRLPGRFAIDYGAGEIVLDRDFAKQANVKIVGIPSPSIERDEQGVIETLDLPGLQVRNVPVVVSQVRGGVDGILGLGLLSHVQATLDQRRSRAVLRPQSSDPREGESWPLLFAGERILLAPAKIDGLDTFVIVNPTARGVKFVPSQAMILEKARRVPSSPKLERVTLGNFSLSIDTQDHEKFPQGVDIAYGFIIGGMLGAEAFRNKAVTTDFKAMTITVE